MAAVISCSCRFCCCCCCGKEQWKQSERTIRSVYISMKSTKRLTHTHTQIHTRTLGRQSVNSHGRTNNVSWQAAATAAAATPTTATAATPTAIEGWSYIGCACVCVVCVHRHSGVPKTQRRPRSNRPNPPAPCNCCSCLSFLFICIIITLLCISSLSAVAEFQCLRFDWGNRRRSRSRSLRRVALKIQWNFLKAVGRSQAGAVCMGGA